MAQCAGPVDFADFWLEFLAVFEDSIAHGITVTEEAVL